MIDEEPEPRRTIRCSAISCCPAASSQERIPGDQALPLLHVRWRTADQLTLPFCLSAKLANGTLIHNVSVLRGNMVLADHGLTTQERIALAGPVPSTPPFRPRLSYGPLTQQMQPASVQYDSATRPHRHAAHRPDRRRQRRAAGDLAVRHLSDWHRAVDAGSGPAGKHAVRRGLRGRDRQRSARRTALRRRRIRTVHGRRDRDHRDLSDRQRTRRKCGRRGARARGA